MVNMQGATLRKANFLFASFYGAELMGADFSGATLSQTVFASSDLSGATGMDEVLHDVPCTVDGATIRDSKGSIPDKFLRGCGFDQWEIFQSRLYGQPTPAEIQQICSDVLGARLGGTTSRIFISYSHADSKFVMKLYKRLQAEDFIVWLDQHEMSAGSLQNQVRRALAEQDIVIVVLSRNSLKSDWVENELEMAREREKGEQKDVLCPIALDDSWQSKISDQTSPGRALWRKLLDKYVIDFSGWSTRRFEPPFQQLTRGIRANYSPRRQENGTPS
jgi:hypothetical protein